MVRNDSGIERQLLWYKYSQPPDRFVEAVSQKVFYTFLIINTPDQLPLIQQKIYDAVQPMLDDPNIKIKEIEGTVLSYELLRVVSNTNHELNFSQIYRGRVRWDRRLQPRESEDSWAEFLKRVSHGEI